MRELASPTGLSAAASNRWHKVFARKILGDYQSSIYIDGNIRPIGPLDLIFDQLEDGPNDILLPSHPVRSFVAEEVEACVARGKVADAALLDSELEQLVADGFEDAGLLTENNIIARDHGAAELDAAMRLWWGYISEYSGRDQISLPFVLHKSGLRDGRLDFGPRQKNPHFILYPHVGKAMSSYKRVRAVSKARSPENLFYYLMYRLMVI